MKADIYAEITATYRRNGRGDKCQLVGFRASNNYRLVQKLSISGAR